MSITRRTFLLGTTAAAGTALLPAPLLAGPHTMDVVAEAPETTIWVGGHLGEFDWLPFHAATREEAIQKLFRHFGQDYALDGKPYTLEDADLALERAPKMDGLMPDEIKGHHWIRAGLGACCGRCSSETYCDNGARAIGTEVVCEECLTITDLLQGDDYDIELAEERLVEVMALNECSEDDIKEVLARDMDVETIPAAMWAKCLEQARAEL